MKNAQLAKELKEEQLAKAKIKDEAEWEIPKDIRDSRPRDKDEADSVTYESSYLPFLFPNPEAGPSRGKIQGRRVFSNGKELEQPPAAPTADAQASEEKAAAPANRSTPKERSLKKDSKSARQAIFDTAGVGDDLPTQRPASAGFLKPAGVDEPARSSDKVIQGARKTKNKRKPDRPAGDEPEQKKQKSK